MKWVFVEPNRWELRGASVPAVAWIVGVFHDDGRPSHFSGYDDSHDGVPLLLVGAWTSVGRAKREVEASVNEDNPA